MPKQVPLRAYGSAASRILRRTILGYGLKQLRLSTISITAVFEYGLVDWFQRSFDYGFHNLVLKIADA
jgi:hypothetical protein